VGAGAFGAYLELGYDLLHPLRRFDQEVIPFVRWEIVNTHDALAAIPTPGVSDATSFLTIGATYKPHPQIAFKLDYRRRLDDGSVIADENRLAAGLGLMF
jgi:hypothetical protein